MPKASKSFCPQSLTFSVPCGNINSNLY
jgi:hypothetical protein